MSVTRYTEFEIRLVASAILWDRAGSPRDKGHQRLRNIQPLLLAFPEAARLIGVDHDTPPSEAAAHHFVCAALDEANAAAHFARYGDGDEPVIDVLAKRWSPGHLLVMHQAKQVLGDWALGGGFISNSDTYDHRSNAIQSVLHAASWRILQAEESRRMGDGVNRTGDDYLAILSR